MLTRRVHFRMAHLAFRFFTVILTTALLIHALTPTAAAQSSRNARGAMQRLRALQQAQRQQMIKELQTQYATLESSLSQAQLQMEASQGSLQTAESRRDRAQDQVDAKEHELATAHRVQKGLEDDLLAAQPAESPARQAQRQLEDAQRGLHDEIHRIVGTPMNTHEKGVSSEVSQDLAKLTAEQRAQVKADPGYQQAQATVDRLKQQVRETRQKVLERDASWKTAETQRLSLVDQLKSLKSDLKETEAAVGHSHQQSKTARAAVASTQQRLQATTLQLSNLGATPGTPAK